MLKKIIPIICLLALLVVHISASKPQWRYKGHKKIEIVSQEGIRSIKSFREIKDVLEATTNRSLVVFDVDETLIIHEDAILRPCGESIREKVAKKAAAQGQEKEEELELLTSIALKESKVAILDQALPKLLKDLQKRHVKTIGLTATPPGPMGVIENMADWRLDSLKGLGVDFSKSFDSKPVEFDNDSLFKEGILFLGKGEDKGALLAAFLEKMDHKPDQVIFIDDKAKFLKSMDKAMKEKGIPCQLYQIKAADSWGSSLSKKMARRQLIHLRDNHAWMSDKEARR